MSKYVCEICTQEMVDVWDINNGIVPNLYRNSKEAPYKKSRQKITFCNNCLFLRNNHEFTTEYIFSDYVYRSPTTDYDNSVVSSLVEYFSDKSVSSVVEIGGNNGIFAKKMLDNGLNCDQYVILDKVPLSVSDSRLLHIEEYLTNKTTAFRADLVIVRHAFAHNASLIEFRDNIIDCFKPKYIYIECSDFRTTLASKDFSQLYAEHFYSLSSRSVKNLFGYRNYHCVSESYVNIHNGSFGIILSDGVVPESVTLAKESYNVSHVISSWCNEVQEFWSKIDNKPIVIWGCSAKTVFTLNALELNLENVTQIFDSTLQKEKMFPPGIPISVQLEPNVVDLTSVNLVIGARNFQDMIVPKAKIYFPNGQIYVPPF